MVGIYGFFGAVPMWQIDARGCSILPQKESLTHLLAFMGLLIGLNILATIELLWQSVRRQLAPAATRIYVARMIPVSQERPIRIDTDRPVFAPSRAPPSHCQLNRIQTPLSPARSIPSGSTAPSSRHFVDAVSGAYIA